jgi:hypothetical protein
MASHRCRRPETPPAPKRRPAHGAIADWRAKDGRADVLRRPHSTPETEPDWPAHRVEAEISRPSGCAAISARMTSFVGFGELRRKVHFTGSSRAQALACLYLRSIPMLTSWRCRNGSRSNRVGSLSHASSMSKASTPQNTSWPEAVGATKLGTPNTPCAMALSVLALSADLAASSSASETGTPMAAAKSPSSLSESGAVPSQTQNQTLSALLPNPR